MPQTPVSGQSGKVFIYAGSTDGTMMYRGTIVDDQPQAGEGFGQARRRLLRVPRRRLHHPGPTIRGEHLEPALT